MNNSLLLIIEESYLQTFLHSLRKSIAKLNYNIFSYFSFLCCSITIFLPMIDLLHWAIIEDSQSIIDCVPTYAMAELIVLLATICTNIISHKHCTK